MWITVLFLLFGWWIFLVGELVGLVLLWEAPCWTRREKIVGTLIPVWFAAVYAGMIGLAAGAHGEQCSSIKPCGGSSITVLGGFLIAAAAACIVAAFASAAFLVRRAKIDSR